jgi:hypothetical protein
MPTGVHPEIVDFGSPTSASGSVFAIPPAAGHSAAIPRIAKKQKRRPEPKDAISGWTLTGKAMHILPPKICQGDHAASIMKNALSLRHRYVPKNSETSNIGTLTSGLRLNPQSHCI